MELKKVRVIMLSTDKGIILNTRVEPNSKGHLYFTSDEKPKKGDWFMHMESYKKKDWFPTQVVEVDEVHWDSRKIIATTDSKLTECPCGTVGICHTPEKKKPENRFDVVPQIPQSFIKKYCKEGGIDEVIVEYHNGCDMCKNNLSTCVKIQNMGHVLKQDCDIYWKSIIDINNEVIIHSVKDSWNRDEVKRLCKEAWIQGGKDCASQRYDGPENWIEENL